MAVITIAGEQLIAQKQQAEQPLEIAEFILAYVPGIDLSVPPVRNQVIPPSNQIRLRMAPTRSAYVNANEVVYSLILDNTVGNFDFNWLGLVSEERVLVSANHMVVQSKRKNNELTGEEGNNLTRNFLMKFSGAQAITNLTIPAETWQFNYAEKLNDMDDLLAQLSVGLISTQTSLVLQSHENMTLSEANRTLFERLNSMDLRAAQNSQTLVDLRVEIERNHQQLHKGRTEMDITFAAGLIQTQKQSIEQEHELMKLSESVRMMEKEYE